MNDLVLVRDTTSGAFALQYMPNYRIVAIHGPNRIVVRDEKGSKTVRRASHLKVCDLKEKVMSMVPEQSEYSNCGRSTKLLLHSKDVPDLQFVVKPEDRGKILPNTELSVIQSKVNNMYNSVDSREKVGEIPLKSEKVTEIAVINVKQEYIAGHTEGWRKDGVTPLGAAGDGDKDGSHENHTWFQNPVNCMSKWSKSLKMGVVNSMGLNSSHTASVNSEESERHGFSFFL